METRAALSRNFQYALATASLMGLAALLAIVTYLRRLGFPPTVEAPAAVPGSS